MYGHEEESEVEKIGIKAFLERRKKDIYVRVERSKLKKLIRLAKRVEHANDPGVLACSSRFGYPPLSSSCDCWVGIHRDKINKLVKEMGVI